MCSLSRLAQNWQVSHWTACRWIHRRSHLLGSLRGGPHGGGVSAAARHHLVLALLAAGFLEGLRICSERIGMLPGPLLLIIPAVNTGP